MLVAVGAGGGGSGCGNSGSDFAGTGSSTQTWYAPSPDPTVMYAIGLLAFLWLIYRYKKLGSLYSYTCVSLTGIPMNG